MYICLDIVSMCVLFGTFEKDNQPRTQLEKMLQNSAHLDLNANFSKVELFQFK